MRCVGALPRLELCSLATQANKASALRDEQVKEEPRVTATYIGRHANMGSCFLPSTDRIGRRHARLIIHLRAASPLHKRRQRCRIGLLRLPGVTFCVTLAFPSSEFLDSGKSFMLLRKLQCMAMHGRMQFDLSFSCFGCSRTSLSHARRFFSRTGTLR